VQTTKLRLSFKGIKIQAHIYEPDGEIMHRALFVSSPFGDPVSWSALVHKLTGIGCLCVCADLPGFGFNPSSAEAPQDNDTRAQILWGLLDEIEARRNEDMCKWHLIGHGSGCAAVMHMALYQPDSTHSRVLLNPVIERFMFAPVHGILSSAKCEKLLLALHSRCIKKQKSFRRLLSRLYGTVLPKERISALYKALNRKGVAESLARHMREGYKTNRDVYSVESPVMLIWGANDRIFGGQIPSYLTRKLPKAEKHVLKCAHMSMETAPDAVCDYLRGWFRFSEGREKGVVRPSH